MTPRIFIGSSSESLKEAEAAKAALLSIGDVQVKTWVDDGIFPAAVTFIDSLKGVISDFDFALFIFSGDDQVTSRGQTSAGPRDNVVFEAGLFAGRRGFDRVFIMRPDDVTLKLPSDLYGFNTLRYRANRDCQEYHKSIVKACTQLRASIAQQEKKFFISTKDQTTIGNLLEMTARLAALRYKLRPGDIRAFFHLHDHVRGLVPIVCYTGNRKDEDCGLDIPCSPHNPQSGWFIVSKSFLDNRFALEDVNWPQKDELNIKGWDRVRIGLGAVAAHPIRLTGDPRGVISLDSLKSCNAMGWQSRREDLRDILFTAADTIALLIS